MTPASVRAARFADLRLRLALNVLYEKFTREEVKELVDEVDRLKREVRRVRGRTVGYQVVFKTRHGPKRYAPNHDYHGEPFATKRSSYDEDSIRSEQMALARVVLVPRKERKCKTR